MSKIAMENESGTFEVVAELAECREWDGWSGPLFDIQARSNLHLVEPLAKVCAKGLGARVTSPDKKQSRCFRVDKIHISDDWIEVFGRWEKSR